MLTISNKKKLSTIVSDLKLMYLMTYQYKRYMTALAMTTITIVCLIMTQLEKHTLMMILQLEKRLNNLIKIYLNQLVSCLRASLSRQTTFIYVLRSLIYQLEKRSLHLIEKCTKMTTSLKNLSVPYEYQKLTNYLLVKLM